MLPSVGASPALRPMGVWMGQLGQSQVHNQFHMLLEKNNICSADFKSQSLFRITFFTMINKKEDFIVNIQDDGNEVDLDAALDSDPKGRYLYDVRKSLGFLDSKA